MVERTGKAVMGMTLAGLLPFFISCWASLAPWQASALLGLEEPESIIGFWQIALLSLLIYGAAILSFMGGARWGTAFGIDGDKPKTSVMIIAVTASLWGFFAAMLGAAGLVFGDPMNGGIGPLLPAGLYMLAAGFLVLLAFDVHAGYPILYVRLRILASLLAAATLLAGAIYAG